MGQNVIDKINRVGAPNFSSSTSVHHLYPKHMGVMFGARWDYRHALLHSDQIGPQQAWPRKALSASRSR